MVHNILLFEVIPETLEAFMIPESAVSRMELAALNGKCFNFDTTTTAEDAIFNRISISLSEENLAKLGIQKLKFPFRSTGQEFFHIAVTTR